MRKFLISLLIFHFSFIIGFNQPQREMRGTWFTTAWRIDWPPIGSAQAQINQLILMFNQLEAANINTVFFQVRPFADAFYKSSYEPWSHLLGANLAARGNDPGYDPLALAIKEAHKRGMELHVWLNPYRFESTAGEFAGRPGNYSQTHPHLIINYNNRTYFDPGHPETTQLIKNIVADIANNYDIDGVIFDDYFYPSNMPNSFDDHTFATYGTAEFINRYYPDITRGNFRRASVNNMIKEVNDTIKSINPSLIFGMSPAGIYTTNSAVAAFYGTTLPAGITGNNNWATINCDPLAWLKEGSIDYISPQLYWVIGGNQDFVALTQWWGWQAQRYGRHNYPSLGSYRLYSTKEGEEADGVVRLNGSPVKKSSNKTNDKSGWPVTEIANQIIANRNNPNNTANGLIFYNTNSYLNPDKNLAGYLRNDLFSDKTILPHLTWLPNDDFEIPIVQSIGTIADDPSVVALDINSDKDRFLVYGWTEQPTTKDTSPDFVQVAFGSEFSNIMHRNFQYFAVAEYARNRAAGPMSENIPLQSFDAPIINAQSGATLCEGSQINWTGLPAIESYQVIFFDNQYQSKIINSVDVGEDKFFQINNSNILGQTNHYYRVRGNIGNQTSYSALDSFFVGFPKSTTINHPSNGDGMVPVNTVAQWQLLPEASSYSLQVATDGSFSESSIVIDQTGIGQNIFNLSLPQENTQYFLRVAGVNSCGTGNWSATVSFTTYPGVNVVEPEIRLVNAYPNPTTGQTHIPYSEIVGKRRITVYNAASQVVYNSEKTQPTNQDIIDLSFLPVGFYSGIITTSSGNHFQFKIFRN